MSDISKISTHVADALKRLFQQYKGKNVEGLLTSLVTGYQSLEGIFFDLKEDRTLSNATGDTLENIGAIVGVTRFFGESDADYRKRVKLAIFKNRAQGTAKVLIETVQNFTDASVVVFFEGAEASFGFVIDEQNLTQDQIDALYEGLKTAKLAGVTIEHVTSYTEEAFGFDGDPNALGFGKSTDGQTSGGKFAQLLVPTIVTELLTESGDEILLEDGVTILAV